MFCTVEGKQNGPLYCHMYCKVLLAKPQSYMHARAYMRHDHPARYIICLKVKCGSDRRLLSRFRSGCHGLRVDTGRWENNVHLDRKDRLRLVCSSAQQVQDEHHFLFDCPAYSSIRASHTNLFQCACSVSDFFDSCEANAWWFY